MSPARLSCEGLAKTWPGSAAPALDGVSLEASAGSIVVLLGASGSGKTTLLRIVAGLETADAGRILLGDRVLSDPAPRVPAERRGVGMVFQHLELWPHMTVAENVAFGLPDRPRGRRALAHPQVAALAERVGIAALLPRRPDRLSGGERQRVAIARALAPEPAALLYDEPLANLDPDRRADLRLLVRSLARERGTAVLYVTHDPEEAFEVGDEVVVLYGGRVVERGPPEEVYRRPRTLEGARALGPVTVLEGAPAGDRFRTPLGDLPTAAAAPGARWAVLRPEDVVPATSGVEATVTDARPRGPDWAFQARVGDVEVHGRSAERLAPGATVRLAVLRRAAAVAPARSAGPR